MPYNSIFDTSRIADSPRYNLGNPAAAGPAIAGGGSPYSFNYGSDSPNTPVSASPGAGLPKQDKGFSFGEWADIGTGLVNAYTGYEGLKLGKEQFGFAKDSFNKNLANQAQLINNQQEANQRARLETSGQYTGEGGQANLQQDLQSYLKPRQVSGAPI